MNKERLLNVAKALRESPNPDKFDMGQYMHPCGTPACAFGHYAVRTDLQSEFTAHASPPMPWNGVSTTDGDENISYDDDVVLDHFDITEAEADRLFADGGYAADTAEARGLPGSTFLALSANTANEAADWIERFVAEHE